MMKRILGVGGLCVALFVALAVPSLAAQTITRTLAWDQGGVSTVAQAQALSYRLQIDALPAVAAPQTCALVGTVITCTTPLAVLPSLTVPGPHTITLTVDNGFSTASASLSGTQVIGPANVKIVTTLTVTGP